jgi:hypothetical protein
MNSSSPAPIQTSISAAIRLNFAAASNGLVDCRSASRFGCRLLLERTQAAHRSHFIDRQHAGLEKLHLHCQFGLLIACIQVVKHKLEFPPADALSEEIARQVIGQ